MDEIILVEKYSGETPLEVIQYIKATNPEYAKERIAYAGRLDPMAEGKLLLLIGEACKRRDLYQNLTKTYEFEVLLGIKSDTYDILGIPELSHIPALSDSLKSSFEKELHNFTGTYSQAYPVFSSKAVNGKPLFWWANEGRLNEIEIPTKEVTVSNITIISNYTINSDELLQTVHTRVRKVRGDFRFEEILSSWDDILKKTTYVFPIVKLEATVSSGTYVRSIAHAIGTKLGYGSLAYTIKRTEFKGFPDSEAKIKIIERN